MQTTGIAWPSYRRPTDKELTEGKFTANSRCLQNLVSLRDHEDLGTQDPAGPTGRCRYTHPKFPRAPVQATLSESGVWVRWSPLIIESLSTHLSGMNCAAVSAQRPGIWNGYPNPVLVGAFPSTSPDHPIHS